MVSDEAGRAGGFRLIDWIRQVAWSAKRRHQRHRRRLLRCLDAGNRVTLLTTDMLVEDIHFLQACDYAL